MSYDIEQYKIMMTLWDSEIGRFYSRHNLYIGIQLAALAGILAGLESLRPYPGLIRIGIIFLLLVGFVNALIAWRGVATQRLTLKVIADIEARNVGLDLLALGRGHTRSSLTLNFFLSASLAWLLFVLWVALWIYLETLL
jgi:hypothetical protein